MSSVRCTSLTSATSACTQQPRLEHRRMHTEHVGTEGSAGTHFLIPLCLSFGVSHAGCLIGRPLLRLRHFVLHGLPVQLGAKLCETVIGKIIFEERDIQARALQEACARAQCRLGNRRSGMQAGHSAPACCGGCASRPPRTSLTQPATHSYDTPQALPTQELSNHPPVSPTCCAAAPANLPAPASMRRETVAAPAAAALTRT